MITLRQFQTSDAELLVTYLNTPEVTQYITGAIPSPYTPDDALWWIKHANQTDHIKAIEYQGKFVGCISATVGQFEYAHSAELGYWIGKQFWNLGIASEAVNQFCTILFDNDNLRELSAGNNLNRLFVSVVAQNKASIRVLEKNGFSLEGVLKNASFKVEATTGVKHFFDEHLMAKLAY